MDASSPSWIVQLSPQELYMYAIRVAAELRREAGKLNCNKTKAGAIRISIIFTLSGCRPMAIRNKAEDGSY